MIHTHFFVLTMYTLFFLHTLIFWLSHDRPTNHNRLTKPQKTTLKWQNEYNQTIIHINLIKSVEVFIFFHTINDRTIRSSKHESHHTRAGGTHCLVNDNQSFNDPAVAAATKNRLFRATTVYLPSLRLLEIYVTPKMVSKMVLSARRCLYKHY